ncbi:Flavin reductase like domain-containing protein [Entamoeba marina]
MNKQQVDLAFATRLINLQCIVIPTVYDAENKRVTGMPAQWVMPLSKTQVAVLFNPYSHTGKLITETKKYVLNIPTVAHEEAVKYTGTTHGNVVNKFENTPFHFGPSITPGFGNLTMNEAIGSLELELASIESIPDEKGEVSKLLIGNVVAASADPTRFDGKFYTLNDTKLVDRPIHCNGEWHYLTTKPIQ